MIETPENTGSKALTSGKRRAGDIKERETSASAQLSLRGREDKQGLGDSILAGWAG